MAADPPDPPLRHFNLKPKDTFARANAPDVAAAPSAGHDVAAWRQDVIAFEAKAGLGDLKPTSPRANRRRRDFFLVAGTMDAALSALAIYGALHGNIVLIAASVVGIAIFTGTLAWVMWGVMSRY